MRVVGKRFLSGSAGVFVVTPGCASVGVGVSGLTVGLWLDVGWRRSWPWSLPAWPR